MSITKFESGSGVIKNSVKLIPGMKAGIGDSYMQRMLVSKN